MDPENFQEQVKETRRIFEKISRDLETDEGEKKEIEVRIKEINTRKGVIEEEVKALTHKKDLLAVLLDEIDIGYDKILASSQCLSILASRKLRKLKRKYLKFLK
jgi:predicted nuclease with TOPRIM domain